MQRGITFSKTTCNVVKPLERRILLEFVFCDFFMLPNRTKVSSSQHDPNENMFWNADYTRRSPSTQFAKTLVFVAPLGLAWGILMLEIPLFSFFPWENLRNRQFVAGMYLKMWQSPNSEKCSFRHTVRPSVRWPMHKIWGFPLICVLQNHAPLCPRQASVRSERYWLDVFLVFRGLTEFQVHFDF